MKIAYLVSQYPASSHTFILLEILSLKKKGFEIAVASINSPDRPFEKLTPDEQNESANTLYVKKQGIVGATIALLYTLLFHPLGFLCGVWTCFKLCRWNLGELAYHFLYLAEALIIGKWMEEQKLTRLHVHFGMAVSTVALLVSKVFPVKFSMTIHGPDEFYEVNINHLKEKIEDADFITCIGYYAQSQLMRLSDQNQWSKFEVAPLGINIDQFSPAPKRRDPSVVEILSVGRLFPAKGHSMLIKAFSELNQNKQQIRLTIVGTGPEMMNLEKQIADLGLTGKVTLTGQLNHPKVEKMYNEADIFVLSSFSEGIPIVLMEAMAKEIACVSTFVNGIPELIQHERDGILVAPSDVKSLTQALERLIADYQLREKYGAAGRKRVIEKYNINSNTDKLTEILIKRMSPP